MGPGNTGFILAHIGTNNAERKGTTAINKKIQAVSQNT